MRLFRRSVVTPPSEEARTIRLGGEEIAYALRRSARRTFALQVDARGVRVSVPLRAGPAEIEHFIVSHERWLRDRLARQAAQPVAPEFAGRDGEAFPMLGEPRRLSLQGAARGARWRRGADGIEEFVPGAGQEPRAALVAALKRCALPWFAGRVAEYCHRLGLAVPSVRLTSARTRWGSCSARSGIRLHWRLIHLPPALGDYVVAHEVAHLVEMNHSPRFWAIVASIYPDWQSARVRLRAAAQGLPRLDRHSGDMPFGED